MPQVGLRPRDVAPAATDLRKILADNGSFPSIFDTELALDPHKNLVYIYTPTTSGYGALHCLDVSNLQSLKMAELTHDLFFKNPASSPWAKDVHRPLPDLHDRPCFGSFYLNGKHLLALWGGRKKTGNNEEQRSSSDLITIDPEKKRWSVERVEGTPGVARFWACMAIIGHKIFIFDGISQYNADIERDCTGLRLASYSCLEYIQTEDCESWKWVATDVPYPQDVHHSRFENATVINDGAHLLLTPCRKSPANGGGGFSGSGLSNIMWIFDVNNGTFQPLNAVDGKLPKRLSCYHSWSFKPPPHDSPDVALICCWMTTPNGYILTFPVLYKLSFGQDFQSQTMEKLNIGAELKKVAGPARMHQFVIINNEILLLGDSDPSKDDHERVLDIALKVPVTLIGI